MDYWLDQIQDELAGLKSDGLLRALRVTGLTACDEHASANHLNGSSPTCSASRWVVRDGQDLLNLASNDYLALAQHTHLKTRAIDAIMQFGLGAGASRLVSGHHLAHQQLEQRFAKFKHAEAALLFPTGYMANLAAVTALAGPDDLICLDKLSHASLIDASRLSGAQVRAYPHLNLARLEVLLQRFRESQKELQSGKEGSGTSRSRALILTDSVFSMDGDVANLPALCDLADRYDAILIVDEAHATGVLGETGSGLCELQQVADRVDVVISTASKALGSMGGLVTAKQVVIDWLVNCARSFIYTTGAMPTQVAAIGGALDIVHDDPQRRERLAALATELKSAIGLLDESNQDCPLKPVTPIVPIPVGQAPAAVALANQLQSKGFLAPAIRPPTVAPGTSRVRISLRADLEDQEVVDLIDVIRQWQESQ